MLKNNILSVCALLLFFACQQSQNKQEQMQDEGTFEYDVDFLSRYQKIVVLKKDHAMLAVCPAYQGRVMTSSSGGEEGMSYGWINYNMISSGQKPEHILPVGGEDRFWLGPEGGQFSLYFKQGDEFIFDHWQTPAPIDTEPFDLVSYSDTNAIFNRKFTLENYSGTHFKVEVQREVSLLADDEVQGLFPFKDDLNFVAYQSENTLKNIGQNPWTKDTGALSVWILGMFRPSDATTIMVPFVQGDASELGPVVNDAYFGKVPDDRIKIGQGVIYFKGDGKHRAKIGLNPQRAMNYLGSFDDENSVLTLVFFNKPGGVTDYVNSMWQMQEHPFAGDVANAYNDGPVDGKAMGPFYELESSSPAAFLLPDSSITHVHSTIHIQGDDTELNPIIKQLFHTSLDSVRTIFQP